MKAVNAILCGLVLAGAPLPVRAADAPKPVEAKQPAAAPGMPALPKPGPEQEVLKAQEGSWDAVVESWMELGKPPVTTQGTEVGTLLGGLWLATDFKGDFMGAPFQGRGVMGWDASKKKYVSTWVDSMSAGLTLGEATYDAATKTIRGVMEGPDMSGHVMKMNEAMELKDADHRVFTMSITGPDGHEVPMMRITYKRRQ